MSQTPTNPFIHGPLGSIFAKTAVPIIFVMGMNGLLTIVDAIFLGRYVGADALGAVTLIFPIYMLIVALATLVANGMSSILARHLGAQDHDSAAKIFVGAHGMALFVSFILIIGYLLFGRLVTMTLASGLEPLANMGQTYLAITAFTSPLAFVLAVNSDALRNEGRVGFMAAMSLLVSLSNIGFNYVFIALLGLGVAGSAYGTAMAQLLALGILVYFRIYGATPLRLDLVLREKLFFGWSRILALGAPQSLNFIGIALGSAATIGALQWVETPTYETTVSAYGIVTRVLTMSFLPLLGMTHALQSIAGNNYGANALDRSDQSLRISIWVSLIYCIIVQAIYWYWPVSIARLFVNDPDVIAEFARIMPIMTAMMWLAGPIIMVSAYFQAIGNATRAAIIGLSRAYFFGIPLMLILPHQLGEAGIWISNPVAELAMALLTLAVLAQTSRSMGLRLGLFAAPVKT